MSEGYQSRRRAEDQRVAELEQSVEKLEETVEKLMKQITDLQKSIATVVGVIQAAKGALDVLEFLGKCVKPFLWLGTFAAAIGVILAKIRPGG